MGIIGDKMGERIIVFLLTTLLLFALIYTMLNIDHDNKIVYDGGFFRIMQQDEESLYMEVDDDGGPIHAEINR